MASSLVPENLYPVFRATEMKTNVVRVLENLLFPNHALRSELDALMIAKAGHDAGSRLEQCKQ
jgi:hypothetical protein